MFMAWTVRQQNNVDYQEDGSANKTRLPCYDRETIA